MGNTSNKTAVEEVTTNILETRFEDFSPENIGQPLYGGNVFSPISVYEILQIRAVTECGSNS